MYYVSDPARLDDACRRLCLAMTTAGDGAVLRVKRKRADDPVDAFLFQFHTQSHLAKRRGTQPHHPPDQPGHGMFRRRETVNIGEQMAKDAQVIEAEWDSFSKRMRLKRKHEQDTETTSVRRKHQPSHLQEEDKAQDMNCFSDMLSEYLRLNQVSLESHDTSAEAANEYVFDIYYQDTTPMTAWRHRDAKNVNCVPTVGRARTKSNKPHSSVPISGKGYDTGPSTTTAPGFEHLQDPEEDVDWMHEASFYPVHLRTTMDENGRTLVTAVPIGAQGLAENDLMLEEIESGADLCDDDEDSNDEDFYRNDYPDQDEWDADSDTEW